MAKPLQADCHLLTSRVNNFTYPLSNPVDAQVYVIRFPDLQVDESKFLKAIDSLLQSKYQYTVPDHKAPAVTNCVTAVRYLLGKSSSQKLPPVYIGDMPRVLVTRCRYTVQKVKISEMRLGDLIFFKWNSSNVTRLERRYICHIACALGPAQIFHSSQERTGGHIENLAKPIDLSAKAMLSRVIDLPPLFLRYIDPRNQKLRDEFGTDLIPFPVPRSLSLQKTVEDDEGD